MALVQEIVAAALVLASVLYAVWRLSPQRVRVRLLGRLASAPVFGRWRWLARRHSAALQDGGCSGCSAGGIAPGSAGVRSRSGARTRTPAAPPR